MLQLSPDRRSRHGSANSAAGRGARPGGRGAGAGRCAAPAGRRAPARSARCGRRCRHRDVVRCQRSLGDHDGVGARERRPCVVELRREDPLRVDAFEPVGADRNPRRVIAVRAGEQGAGGVRRGGMNSVPDWLNKWTLIPDSWFPAPSLMWPSTAPVITNVGLTVDVVPGAVDTGSHWEKRRATGLLEGTSTPASSRCRSARIHSFRWRRSSSGFPCW